ncbi:hypothetical protein L7F22_009414 [Adiantum nelumboides]|nr:hypothetical protein [Adiantum nelumboides]
MRHLLLKSSVLNTNLRKAFARSIASEPAVHRNDGADRNGTTGQRWQQHENQVLIAGIEKQQLELEKSGRWNAEQSRKKKWDEIENFCHLKGINRTADQCRCRWTRLLHAFFKVKSWENCIPRGKSSFWLMGSSEKKVEGLPLNLDQRTFDMIDVIQSRKESWYSTAVFSGGDTDNLERDECSVQQQSDTADYEARQSAAETDDSCVEAETETGQCMEVQKQSEMADFETQQCITVKNQPKRDLERDQWAEVQHQPVTDDPLHCTEETAISICSDQDAHPLKDSSSADFTGCTHNAHNDDRPAVLVQFINQCLVDLEGLEYEPCDQLKAQVDEDKGLNNRRRSS